MLRLLINASVEKKNNIYNVSFLFRYRADPISCIYCDIVGLTQTYLKQPLCVVLHGNLQLFQPLSRLVLVPGAILLDWVVAAALGLAVFLLRQQKGVATWPILDLVLPLTRSTVPYPQTKAES